MDKEQQQAFEKPDLCDLLEQAKVDLLTAPYPAIALSVKRIDAALVCVKQKIEWKPIATAPKDGTQILLYAPDYGHGERVTAGAWTTWLDTAPEYHATTGAYLGQSIQDEGAGWETWDGGFADEWPPTHWRELPAAPTSQEQTQAKEDA